MSTKRRCTVPQDPLHDIEALLSFICGKHSMHSVAGSLAADGKDWKKHSRKLLHHLEQYISANLITDRAHREDIHNTINQIKQGVDLRTQVREPYLVAFLVKLCLLLLGKMPNHWNKKAVNHHEHFLLDQYRSLHYSQSYKQRAALILDALRKQGQAEFGNEAHRKYSQARNTERYHEFVEWYQQVNPSKYAKLFC
jgi:hypothetical protein